MKLTTDTARCVGHGRCAIVAPGLIELNDTGYNQTPELEVPEGSEPLARRVVKACPERIIAAVDDTPS